MSEWSPIDAPESQWSTIDTGSGAGWGAVGDGGNCGDWEGISNDTGCDDFDNLLCWILGSGRWADACFWRDLSLWNDGVADYQAVA